MMIMLVEDAIMAYVGKVLGLSDFSLEEIELRYSDDLTILYTFDIREDQKWRWIRTLNRNGREVWQYLSVVSHHDLASCVNHALENAELCGELHQRSVKSGLHPGIEDPEDLTDTDK